MDKVKESFAKHDQAVEDFVEGARLDVGLEAMCALEEDEERTLRELMLAVHVEACWTCSRALVHPDTTAPCEQAKALKELAL